MGQGFRSIADQSFQESTGNFPFTIISDFFLSAQLFIFSKGFTFELDPV